MQSCGHRPVRRKSTLSMPMAHRRLFLFLRTDRQLAVNGYIRSKGILMALLRDTRQE